MCILSSSEEHIWATTLQRREILQRAKARGLISALQNPDLFRTACDDERYLRIALQGIAVLAWDDPAMASELLVRFDANKSRDNPNSDARRTARAIVAAVEWRQLESQELLPVAELEVLRDFLRLYPALGDKGEHCNAMRQELEERPHYYADLFRKLTKHTQIMPGWIMHLEDKRGSKDAKNIQEGDKEQANAKESPLEQLSESQLNALSAAIKDVRASLRASLTSYVMWALVIGAFVAFPNALGALIALVIIGGAMSLGEGRSYETLVRPRLVQLAIEHGVGAHHVVSWLYRLSREAGRAGRFDIRIENDQSLEILAALSRSTSSAPVA
jgi:hypothetical protein